MESVTSENSCHGKTTESTCESCCRHLEKEIIPDDWNEEIGSLTDDDVTVAAANNQSKERDGLQQQTNSVNHATSTCKEGKKNHHPKLLHQLSWQNALKKAKCLPDPWEKFHIDDSCPTEVAIRHRYNALQKNWVQDEVRVKMESLVSLSYEMQN